jgi:hypothetical protein
VHLLDNGLCVSCAPRVTANFDVHEPRDHHGKWIDIGGVDVPDLGALHNLDNFDLYESTYDVHDESSVDGFAAISMTNGDTQVAFDSDTHRYVLADTDPQGMRDFADTLDHMLESYHTVDLNEAGKDTSPGELVDYETWDDGDITVGYDASGDFKVTHTDTGHEVNLPELTAEQVTELIDALREQADAAEALADNG